MMGCPGLHCNGCGHGATVGFGGVLAAGAVVACVKYAPEIERFFHDLLMALVIIAVCMGVTGVATVAAVVLRRHRGPVRDVEPLRVVSVQSPAAVRERPPARVLARPVPRIDRTSDREFVYQVTERKMKA